MPSPTRLYQTKNRQRGRLLRSISRTRKVTVANWWMRSTLRCHSSFLIQCLAGIGGWACHKAMAWAAGITALVRLVRTVDVFTCRPIPR